MNAEIERLVTLEKGIGSSYVEQSIGYKPLTDIYGLSETEFLLIRMLVSNGQSLIQRHLYDKTQPTELESLLCKYLDQALAKVPKEDTTTTVYRVTCDCYFSENDKGKSIVYPAYLTASKKLLSTDHNCEYEIHLAGRTQAKSIYKVYEIDTCLPEEQVEFPRNTAFYVEDFYFSNGITCVVLYELPDVLWPIDKLTNRVSEFFNDIEAINIHEAVDKGLDPRIDFMATFDGRVILAECSPYGKVRVSPCFAQAFWNLCYAGLSLADGWIIKEELAAEGTTLAEVCKAIDAVACQDSRALYLKAINVAFDWEKLLVQMHSLLMNFYTEEDNVFLGGIDCEGEIEKRVGGMYKTGMGFILLHELSHYDKGHFQRQSYENIKDLELEADSLAFDSVLALKDNTRKTAILGSIAALLLPFYINPYLKSNHYYYREDKRLFTQYDKIKNDENVKKESSIFVANVLSEWLARYHSYKIEVKRYHEDETVEEIRTYLKSMK